MKTNIKPRINEQIQDYRNTRNKLSEINELERMTAEKVAGEVRNCVEVTPADKAHILAQAKQLEVREELDKKKAAILKEIDTVKDLNTRDALKFHILGGIELEEAIRLATISAPEQRSIVRTNVNHFLLR
ncbi:MAG: hypothetical protein K6D92_04435 [Erysipelotrichaceae bacterium]|nr:hypothetical protein [Erysipelotrichaceae bacterium]